MMMHGSVMRRRTGFTAATLCLVAVLAGCAATHQAPSAKPSGFLRDYSQLREGRPGEALLVYIKPDVDWRRYDKMMIEPVAIWGGGAKSGTLEDVPHEEEQVLVDYFDAALREELGKDYKLVDRPGPGVLRLRVAITEAEGSTVPLDVLSTFVPQMRTLSGVKRVATGTAAFVGKAGAEGEIKDSMSDERLAAAVDRQAGQKRAKGVLETWDDVQGAFDHWAQRVRARLAELRSGSRS